MLTIKILGQTGSGKTTLASSLADWLRLEGFTDVIVKDMDGDQHPELQNQRLAAIKNTPITIGTIQLQRNYRINNPV